MLKIAIVDDDVKMQETIRKYLLQYSEEQSQELEFAQYEDGDRFVEEYRCQFDLLLLDIQMKFVDGLTAAQMIRKIDPEVIIIFITQLDQYALKGYEVEALDYILKPVDYFVLSETITRAASRLANRQDESIMINIKGGVKKLSLSSLLYIESQGHDLIYHCLNDKVIGRGTLKSCEQELQDFHFFRCNKGLLVNLKHVDSVKDNKVYLKSHVLSIGRTRKKAFLEALVDYMGKVIK